LFLENSTKWFKLGLFTIKLCVEIKYKHPKFVGFSSFTVKIYPLTVFEGVVSKFSKKQRFPRPLQMSNDIMHHIKNKYFWGYAGKKFTSLEHI